jgi:hypothetical protein
LQGLGDIELLGLCSTAEQFRQAEQHTRTALTFDAKLNQALALRKSLFAAHEPIRLGEDSVQEIQLNLEELTAGQQRLSIVAEEEETFLRRAGDYLNALSWS